MVPFHPRKGHTSTSKNVYSALPETNRATMILLQTPVEKKKEKKKREEISVELRGLSRSSGFARNASDEERYAREMRSEGNKRIHDAT